MKTIQEEVIKLCSIEGCNKKHEAKGYCSMHYQKFIRYGDPLIFKKSNRIVIIENDKIQCIYCGMIKNIEYFVKDKNCIIGRISVCKECRNAKDRLPDSRIKTYKNKKKQIKIDDPVRMRAYFQYHGAKSRSKQKNIPFNLDLEYVYQLMIKNTNCPCCKIPFNHTYEFKNDKRKPDIPTLDRFIPSKGYTKDNVVVICWLCNTWKRDATSQQLRTIADWMDTYKIT